MGFLDQQLCQYVHQGRKKLGGLVPEEDRKESGGWFPFQKFGMVWCQAYLASIFSFWQSIGGVNFKNNLVSWHRLWPKKTRFIASWLLLMEKISHQLIRQKANIPLLTEFYTSKRWLALGFLNNQQYEGWLTSYITSLKMWIVPSKNP